MKSLKDRTLDTLLPLVGQSLQAREPAEKAASRSIVLLKQAGISPASALKEFTWETIQKAADGYSIPALMRPAVHQWLRTYLTELPE